MLFDGDLLVSVPGHQALRQQWTGSVVDLNDMMRWLEQDDLKLALELILEEANRRQVRVMGSPRPEIFHSSMALAALSAKAEHFTQHLCFTDGVSLKTLRGFDNYVFFYQPAHPSAKSALALLCERAPEAMMRLQGQINSDIWFGEGATQIKPPVVCLTRRAVPTRPPAAMRPFFFSHYSAQDTINRIRLRSASTILDAAEHDRLVYIPLTEVGLMDPAFARVVAELLLRAYVDSQLLLVLRLPQIELNAEAVESSMDLVYRALVKCGIVLPRTPLSNAFIAEADIQDEFPSQLGLPFEIYLHDSFDHWRHSRAFYASARRVHLFAGMQNGSVLPHGLDSAAYGSGVVRRRLELSGKRS